MMKGYPVSSSSSTPNSSPGGSPTHSRTGTPVSSTMAMTLGSLVGKAALGKSAVPLNPAALDIVRANTQKAAGKSPF